MGHYKKTQPVHPVQVQIQETTHTIERTIEKEPQQKELNVEDLANAIAKAITLNVPMSNTSMGLQQQGNIRLDTFDASKTLESLAKSMLVQRGNSESNFDKSLGNVEETKVNPQETNDKIDLLSDLDD